MIFVNGRGKGAIEDHFDMAYELERTQADRGKDVSALKGTRLTPGNAVFVRQQEPLGLGHAIWCARDIVGDEPFAVVLPDELVLNTPGCLKQMIEDELNEFLSALRPNNAALRRLLLGRKLDEDDKDLVEDVLLANEQSIEQCNSNIKSIVGVRDAHRSASDNSLNQTMKLLTLATLVVAIPNMFFGLYGMNVDTPFRDSPYAFVGIMVFTVLITVAIYVLGRKKRLF